MGYGCLVNADGSGKLLLGAAGETAGIADIDMLGWVQRALFQLLLAVCMAAAADAHDIS